MSTPQFHDCSSSAAGTARISANNTGSSSEISPSVQDPGQKAGKNLCASRPRTGLWVLFTARGHFQRCHAAKPGLDSTTMQLKSGVRHAGTGGSQSNGGRRGSFDANNCFAAAAQQPTSSGLKLLFLRLVVSSASNELPLLFHCRHTIPLATLPAMQSAAKPGAAVDCSRGSRAMASQPQTDDFNLDLVPTASRPFAGA